MNHKHHPSQLFLISTICLVVLFLFTNTLIAQKDSTNFFIRPASINFLIGGGGYYGKNLKQEDYKKINSTDPLINTAIGNNEPNTYSTSNDHFDLNLSATFQFFDKRKKTYNNQIEIKAGIAFQSYGINTVSYTYEKRSPFDTLKSTQSNTVYYIDTLKTYKFVYSYKRQNICFHLTNTFHTKQNRIISLYTGYSIDFGYTINNVVNSERYYTEQFKDQNGKNFAQYYSESAFSHKIIHNTTKLNSAQTYAISMPIGIILRPVIRSKSTTFALNSELRFGYRSEQIADYGDYTSLFIQVQFGVKFFLHKEKFLKSYRYKNRNN